MVSKRAQMLFHPELRNYSPIKTFIEYFQQDNLDATISPRIGSDYSRFMSLSFVYAGGLSDESSTEHALTSLGERIASIGLKCENDYSLPHWRMYLGKESFETITGTPGIIAVVSQRFYKNPYADTSRTIEYSLPDGFVKKITLPLEKQLIVAEVGISPLPLGTRPSFLTMASLLTGKETVSERIKDTFFDFANQHAFLDDVDYRKYLEECGRGWFAVDISH